jgi:hypothetical protein
MKPILRKKKIVDQQNFRNSPQSLDFLMIVDSQLIGRICMKSILISPGWPCSLHVRH